MLSVGNANLKFNRHTITNRPKHDHRIKCTTVTFYTLVQITSVNRLVVWCMSLIQDDHVHSFLSQCLREQT